jgi:hypothetical protein
VVLILAIASANTLLIDEESTLLSRARRQAESFAAETEAAENSAEPSSGDSASKQIIPFPSSVLPNSEECVYTNNRQFLGLVLYVRINVASALECGNAICSSDPRCTHFTYNPNVNGGTCTLCSQPGSGGTWSVPTPPSSRIVCGHIPKRSCNPNALLSVCLGLNLGLGILGKK